jgi:hypothetical protein
MKELYEGTQADETLLNVREELRLTDTLIMGMLPNLETGESGQSWRQLLKIVNDMQTAYLDQDSPGMAAGFRQIRGLINDRLAHYKTQDEILKTVEQRRRLVETEQKIALQGERAISTEQLFWLFGGVINIIEAVITDRGQQIEVGTRINQLISTGSYSEPK